MNIYIYVVYIYIYVVYIYMTMYRLYRSTVGRASPHCGRSPSKAIQRLVVPKSSTAHLARGLKQAHGWSRWMSEILGAKKRWIVGVWKWGRLPNKCRFCMVKSEHEWNIHIVKMMGGPLNFLARRLQRQSHVKSNCCLFRTVSNMIYATFMVGFPHLCQ